MKNSTKQHHSSERMAVALVDASSLHYMLLGLGQRTQREEKAEGHIRMNFPALARYLQACGDALDGGPRRVQLTVYAAIDRGSEAQQRLGKSWEAAGFRFLGLDYRACGVSAPPNDVGLRVPTSNLSAPICYALGTLRRYEEPAVIVLSHAFEFAGPLNELSKDGARPALACFRSVLDPRWEKSGLVSREDAPIRFFDMEDEAKELLGVDLFERPVDEGRSASLGF